MRRSAANQVPLPPAATISAAASARAATLRAVRTIVAPSRARRRAIARPIPRLAPVTIMILPASGPGFGHLRFLLGEVSYG